MNFHTVGNILTHLTPRTSVTDSAMISPLRQNQRLEGRRERLYISIDKTRQKGTKIF